MYKGWGAGSGEEIRKGSEGSKREVGELGEDNLGTT